MRLISFLFFTSLSIFYTKSQTVAMQFSGEDCNAIPVNLYADLDSGKAVLLHFFMANCSSCIPAAQTLKAMINNINAQHPGLVKGYAFAFDNTTPCSYASSWVSVNGLDGFYSPMDSGATQVAYYGGFGMPTVVLLGGTNHRVIYGSQVFNTSDTTFMRDSILNLLGPAGLRMFSELSTLMQVYPNPANDAVNIKLSLNEESQATLEMVDITGRLVGNFVNEKLPAGAFVSSLDLSKVPNGSYLLKLRICTYTVSKRLNVTH